MYSAVEACDTIVFDFSPPHNCCFHFFAFCFLCILALYYVNILLNVSRLAIDVEISQVGAMHARCKYTVYNVFPKYKGRKF